MGFGMSLKKPFECFIFLLPALLVLCFSYLWRGFQLDDALIYLRYIKNYQEGHGLVYNPGERFNGLTSPLFTYLMLAASRLVPNLQALTIMVSALFLMGAAYVGGALFTKTKYGALLSSCAVGALGYFYTTFGMETSLFLFLIAMSLYLFKRDSEYFFVALALLVITRSEGIFLALPLAVDFFSKKRRLPNWLVISVALSVFVAPYLFNYFYYGDFLAVTGNAKVGQGKSGLWGKGWIFFNTGYLADWAFSGKQYVEVGLIFVAIYGAFLNRKDRVAALVFVFIGLLLAFYGGLNIPNYHWYYAPFFYFGLLFAFAAVEYVAVKLFYRAVWSGDRVFAGVAFLAILVVYFAQTSGFKGPGRHEAYANIGAWLKANTDEKSTVAMVEIGTVGWYADRYIIDILGLTNKYNADYIASADLHGWLSKYQPNYILRHDPRWAHEESTIILEDRGVYVVDPRFHFDGYALLKKSVNYTNADIAKIPAIYRDQHLLLERLKASSTLGPKFVKMDRSLLAVRAPSSLSLKLDRDTKTIHFSYGVKPEAQGKHEGICMEVIDVNAGRVAFTTCIDANAPPQNMAGGVDVAVNAHAGDIYAFKTVCKGPCRDAWSYWGNLRLP
jgi:arabinofuranosyltransferase